MHLPLQLNILPNQRHLFLDDRIRCASSQILQNFDSLLIPSLGNEPSRTFLQTHTLAIELRAWFWCSYWQDEASYHHNDWNDHLHNDYHSICPLICSRIHSPIDDDGEGSSKQEHELIRVDE